MTGRPDVRAEPRRDGASTADRPADDGPGVRGCGSRGDVTPFRRAMGWAAALVLLAAATPASAGIENTLGLGPRAAATAGTGAARTGHWSGVYYNPAGLVSRQGAEQGRFEGALGVAYSHPFTRVEGLQGRSIETGTPARDTAGLYVAGRYDLLEMLEVGDLALGFSLYVPREIFGWSIRPDDQVQWLHLTDGTRRLAFQAGLAWRFRDWFSVGAGLQVSFDALTFNTGRVTDVRRTDDGLDVDTRLGEEVRIVGRSAPIVGLQVYPADWLSLGATYRGEVNVDDRGHTRVSGAPGLGTVGYQHRFSHYFRPRQWQVGAVVRPVERLTLSADATYEQWSRALTTNRNALSVGRFGDTIVPAVGARWQVNADLSLSGGYRFEKAHWDNFGGPSNLMTNDTHIGTAGVAWTLPSSKPGAGPDVSLEFAARIGRLVPRTERKDWRGFPSDEKMRDNPGYPGYEYGGWLVGGTAGIEASW